MNEIDKIARAQMYLEKLANGINPLTDIDVEPNDIVNNARISRCMFYVSDILKQIVNNRGKLKIEMPERVPFKITQEQLEKFEFSDIPITISEITKRLNSLIDKIYVNDLKATTLTNWLVSINMLDCITINNKTRKSPSVNGKHLGIMSELRQNAYETQYELVLYNRNAQQFIIDNIESVVNSQVE